MKLMGKNVWKVNPCNDTVAKVVLDTLRKENIMGNKVQYYTHANKNLRDIKVICRGLHPSIEEKDIIEDLKKQGFNALRATCLMKRVPTKDGGASNSSPMDTNTAPDGTVMLDKDNQPLFAEDNSYVEKTKLVKIPVHQIDFSSDEDIEKIYKIRGILYVIVKIEPIKVKTEKVVQCKRCQSFGHTSSYCGKQARCVKCAGKHLTSECPFAKRIINPKCVNCGVVGHPASYRGCPFAKEMQLERRNAVQLKHGGKPYVSGRFPALLSNKNIVMNDKFGNTANDKTKQGLNKERQHVSYAGALVGDKTNSQEVIIKQLLITIESQRKQIDEMNKRMAKFESLFLEKFATTD